VSRCALVYVLWEVHMRMRVCWGCLLLCACECYVSCLRALHRHVHGCAPGLEHIHARACVSALHQFGLVRGNWCRIPLCFVHEHVCGCRVSCMCMWLSEHRADTPFLHVHYPASHCANSYSQCLIAWHMRTVYISSLAYELL
jgi:hypothetical protein